MVETVGGIIVLPRSPCHLKEDKCAIDVRPDKIRRAVNATVNMGLGSEVNNICNTKEIKNL